MRKKKSIAEFNFDLLYLTNKQKKNKTNKQASKKKEFAVPGFKYSYVPTPCV